MKLIQLLTYFCLFLYSFAQIADDVIVMQNMNGECSSIWNPQSMRLQDKDRVTVISQTVEQIYYFPDRNCVTSIVGKVGFQWTIKISKLDIDGDIDHITGKPTKCYDFVKLYDSERCDNAKLLKGINFATGLCGTLSESSIGTVDFRTCANFLTIQFKTDTKSNSRMGFAMVLEQFPWSNPTGGPDCDPDMNGIAVGVWRDGTFSEFQNSWNEQPIIPGYVSGGIQTDYDKEVTGIQCYECYGCPVEPFDPVKDATAVSSNCYICSKEWDEEYYTANRKCYTRTDYLNLLQTFAGTTIKGEFVGCEKIVSDYGRNVNYCFCKDNKCNTAPQFVTSYHLSLSLMILTVFLQFYV